MYYVYDSVIFILYINARWISRRRKRIFYILYTTVSRNAKALLR